MAASDPQVRRASAQLAAHTRWANASQRAKADQVTKMRRGKADRWARQIDPDGTMDPAELSRKLHHRLQAEMAKIRLEKAKRGAQN